MGADAMRWLYCRANPAANVNFGPEPVREVRSKLFFKLWNSYAFFCNCAAGDGFDPARPAVPFKDRPDLDRWVLSELQQLVHTGRAAFERYDVMTFAVAAERFVEDDLSNWYVRRVKPRLNSKVADLDEAGLADKWAAYQTLYTVLTTLCRLLAPCAPFVTEVMWRNLTRGTGPESVHLTDYPTPDFSQFDEPVLGWMRDAREVISLGGAARNVAKINVRQPVAELRVRSSEVAVRDAVEALEALIREELNVKAVTLLPEDAPSTLRTVAKLNKKTAAAKLGPKLKEAEAALATLNLEALEAALNAGESEVCGVMLAKGDVVFEYVAADGWAGAKGRNTEVTISTAITEELRAEGLARNVVRMVNQARKDANLDLADAIVLHLGSPDAALARAIATHRATIATETQAVEWLDAPPAGAHTATVKVDGQPLTIALRKV
jgi:isoleucyl-tRNA synthetase